MSDVAFVNVARRATGRRGDRRRPRAPSARRGDDPDDAAVATSLPTGDDVIPGRPGGDPSRRVGATYAPAVRGRSVPTRAVPRRRGIGPHRPDASQPYRWIRSTLLREWDPATISTRLERTPRYSATSLRTAAFAWPPAGAAVTRTTSRPSRWPLTSSCLAREITRTSRRSCSVLIVSDSRSRRTDGGTDPLGWPGRVDHPPRPRRNTVGGYRSSELRSPAIAAASAVVAPAPPRGALNISGRRRPPQLTGGLTNPGSTDRRGRRVRARVRTLLAGYLRPQEDRVASMALTFPVSPPLDGSSVRPARCAGSARHRPTRVT